MYGISVDNDFKWMDRSQIKVMDYYDHTMVGNIGTYKPWPNSTVMVCTIPFILGSRICPLKFWGKNNFTFLLISLLFEAVTYLTYTFL